MKYLATALFALASTGTAVFAQPVAPFYGCETVDQGGYLTFADPTCPAEFTTATADYDPITGAALDNK